MKYLVVANQTLGGQRLREELRELSAPGASFHLVVPATPVPAPADPFREAREWQDPSEAARPGRARAQHRLREGLARFAEAGIEATGTVGDGDPLDAIADAIARDHYDAIVLSTLPPGASAWLKQDLPSRVHRKFGLPVIHVEARQSFVDTLVSPAGPAATGTTARAADRPAIRPPAATMTATKWRAQPLSERILNRRHWYRCKACGTYVARSKPNCPACKTRKGGRGAPPAGSMPM